MNNAFRGFVFCAGATLAFAASAENLVSNPDFDSGLQGWTVTSGDGSEILDTTTGLPTVPSLHLVADASDTDITVTSDCIPVDDAVVYDFYMNMRPHAAFAGATLFTFSDQACTSATAPIEVGSFPATDRWQTFSLTGIELPAGVQSVQISLNATANTGTTHGDAYFDHIALGPTGTALPALNVDQEGLTGTWFNAQTSGQGFQFQITPNDAIRGPGTLFGAWFTYDTLSANTSAQRWYSIQGSIVRAETDLPFAIYQNTGGNFSAPPSTNAVQVGTGSISFESCIYGRFDYVFDDGRAGSIPLTRLLPNVECSDDGAPTNPPSDFGYSGAWYDSAIGGQGIMLELNPNDTTAFFGWYSYALDGEDAGEAGQRWYSAQASYTVGDRVIDLVVYDSTGGFFDSGSGSVTTDPVGTATLTLSSCTEATLDYDFTDGELAGQSGTLPLQRLGVTPDSCPDGGNN